MLSPHALFLIATLSLVGWAETASADDAPSLVTEADSLEPFLWTARPVVVFADTPNDPRFIKQMELLEADQPALLDRDVVVIVDTDPDARSDIRQQLRPRGFQLALIGKDGRVELRKPAPWSVREISRSIDKMPLRRQEIRDRSAASAGSG